MLVKKNPQAPGSMSPDDGGGCNVDRDVRDLANHLFATKEDDLSFCHVEHEAILKEPRFNVRDAVREDVDGGWDFERLAAVVDLHVIGVKVAMDWVGGDDPVKVRDEGDEKDRAEDRTLWDATGDGSFPGDLAIIRHVGSSVCEKRAQPPQSKV